MVTWSNTSVRCAGREEELEARALGPRVVDDVAAVRARVGARDRQAETAPLAGVAAPLEPLEQPLAQLRRDALAVIAHADAYAAVRPRGAERDGRLAVAMGVQEEIGDDALDRGRVGERRQLLAHVEPGLRSIRGDAIDVACDVHEHLRQLHRSQLELDPRGVEPREVEQLLDQTPQAQRLRPERLLQLVPELWRQAVAALPQRREAPVHRGRRRTKLV